jgi:hypothetical protein
MYNQSEFTSALKEAGFHMDGSLFQPGAIFFSRVSKAGVVMVSLYPTHYTVALMKAGKEGLKVVDHLTYSTSKAEFLAKAKEWGLQ